MKIIIDTREQKPYLFKSQKVDTEICKLEVGDYSIVGFDNKIAIERKSLNDLVGCTMGKNRDRFKRELAKAKDFSFFAVMLEATPRQISTGRYYSKIKPHSVFQTLIAWELTYNCRIIFAGDRAGGEYLTYWILRKFVEYGTRF